MIPATTSPRRDQLQAPLIPKDFNKKNLRHIKKALLFSLGPSQLVGTLAVTRSTIDLLYNCAVGILNIPKCRTELGRDKLINQLLEVKDNTKELLAAAISMLPALGVLSSGLFLAATGDLQKAESPTLFSRITEVYSKNVLGHLPIVNSLVLFLMYPLRGMSQQNYFNAVKIDFNPYNAVLSQLNAQQVSITVERGDGKAHAIDTVFIDTNYDHSTKTMVLLPGNSALGPYMVQEASVYKSLGWNVMMMTYGGYPGSDEGLATTEATTIQDIHALIRALEAKGVDKIGLHGFSQGTSVAMHGTQLSQRICFVALEMGYTSAPDVAANYIKNQRLEAPFLKKIPMASVRGLAARAVRAGRRVLGVKGLGGNVYYTDSCDNLTKAAKYKGVFLTIGGDQDIIMGKHREENKFLDNFATDLYEAHVRANPQARETTAFTKIINASHTTSIRDYLDILLAALNAI